MPYKDPLEQKDAQHRHYVANKPKVISRNRQRRADRKKWFETATDGIKCYTCDEKERACLDFHHIDPKEKDMSISFLLNSFRSKERVLKEVDKCVVLCANCHRKFHAGIISASWINEREELKS